MRRPRLDALAAVAVVGLVVMAPLADGSAQPAACGPGTTTLEGTATPADAKTYQLVPFEVPEGTARIEVAYTWDPIDAGVLDLGLWDHRGTAGPEAFRSWSGNRQGRLDRGQAPVVVAPDRIERTVVNGPIGAGTWHVELGVAAVDAPVRWRVEVTCVPGEAAAVLEPDPVDPTHVARPGPGWYAGDFHLHAFHSNPEGPTPEEMVRFARAAGLDIVPVTEYVTPAHWDRLGAAQRDNPDLLLWPGREVITYFGHLVVLGETPSVVEHRVGHEGITVADIQRAAAADGALVSLAHPTIFPPQQFGSACRGCYFELLDEVDWSSTHLIEVVTEGALARLGDQEVPNPFVRTAIELWERLLREGHRLTAVSGSDDKLGGRYGTTRTVVGADELSRPAIDAALRRGRAYVQGLGADSPEVELEATAPDGSTATFGETLAASTAELEVSVVGGDGHVLSLRRNGEEVERVEVVGERSTHRFSLGRSPDEGPLGTFWGIEVLDRTTSPGAELVSVVGNPVFLADEVPEAPESPVFRAPERAAGAASAGDGGSEGGGGTSAWPWVAGAAAVAVVAAAGLARRRRR